MHSARVVVEEGADLVDETTRRGRMQPAAATLLQRWHHAERNEESSRVDDTALARLPMVPCFAR